MINKINYGLVFASIPFIGNFLYFFVEFDPIYAITPSFLGNIIIWVSYPFLLISKTLFPFGYILWSFFYWGESLFLVSYFFIALIYMFYFFLIGLLVGWIIEKIKSKKTNSANEIINGSFEPI